ncbi:MAG: hypothetical protein ACYC7A_16250 [Thermoanaerobaculia bacterium]
MKPDDEVPDLNPEDVADYLGCSRSEADEVLSLLHALADEVLRQAEMSECNLVQ